MSEPSTSPSGQAIGRHGLLRDLNYRAVYERLATTGPSSRTHLARDLALSATSVGRIAERLLDADLLHEGERVTTGVGRPQTLLRLNARAALVAGVSIRSRSMRLHLADLDGRVLAQERVERTDAGADALARQLRDLIRATRARHAPEPRLAAVVIGISGVWNALERQVYAAPNLSILAGLDAQALFREALAGDMLGDAVEIDNDVNLAALGEHEHGAARGVDDFFYLSLGTGIGGASVVSGALQRGLHGFSGELGYLPIHWRGGLRALEDLVGRKALERLVAEAGVSLPDDDTFAYLEHTASEEDVVTDAVSDILGQALVSVVTTSDPGLIVLGGGVGRYSTVWTERIRTRLASFVPLAPPVVSTEIGRAASLLGAVARGRTAARQALLAEELAS